MAWIEESVEVGQLQLADAESDLIAVGGERNAYWSGLDIEAQQGGVLEASLRSLCSRLVDDMFSAVSDRHLLGQDLDSALDLSLPKVFTMVHKGPTGSCSATSNIVKKQSLTLLPDVPSNLKHLAGRFAALYSYSLAKASFSSQRPGDSLPPLYPCAYRILHQETSLFESISFLLVESLFPLFGFSCTVVVDVVVSVLIVVDLHHSRCV